MMRLKLLVLSALSVALAVDRNNFKTCDQASFCKRLRDYKPAVSPYHAGPKVAIEHDSLVADVFNSDHKNAKFVLRVTGLVDSTFHVTLDEREPLYPRYRTQLALDGEPIMDTISLVEQTSDHVTIANTQGHKATVTFNPLKVEFFDKTGNVAVVLNDRGLSVIEHLRVKGGAKEIEHVEGEENALPQDEVDESGWWEENFKSHHDSKPRGPEAVSLDVAFPDAVHIYGIPEHTDGLPLRTTSSGEPYRLYNLDVFEYELDSRMALYGAVPVLYAHGPERSAGVFWHNSAETWVDVDNSADGTVVSSLVNLVTGSKGQKKRVDARFISESGIIDVFVFLGDTPTDVFRQFARLTGAAPIPPRFSLAYHQCRWNYVDEDDVRGVDENFDLHDIPADVIWLDIEYTDRKKYFTWDLEKFRHPTEMVSNLTAKGRKLVVIIDPHIKREAGYFLHEDATDNGYYVKNKDNNDYEGWCWPGSSSYLDFFNPTVSEYYASRFTYNNFPGTSKDVHLWNDMNEPSVFNGPEVTMPKDCRHYKPQEAGVEGISSFWEHRHVHNEYGLSQIKATHEGLVARTDGKYRPFILTRSAFAGTQRYAAVWTGDNMAEWGFLAASVPMCLQLAISGISFCGSDVGGFFKYPESELMTRWYQAGAYQPFFRAHSHIETKRREPWLYDANTMKILRDAIRKRYTLLDMWYTLFYEHSLSGVPVMRPLWQQYPQEPDTYAIDNEYMLGDLLLVRPVTEAGVSSVSVYLPGQENGELWYDTDTYRAHAPTASHSQAVDITKIPVYQRGGTIVPKKERVRRSSVLMADDPYTLAVALDRNGTARGSLYIDDGESYDYRSNKFIYAKFAYNREGLTYTFPDPAAHYATRSWLERIVIAGVTSPPKTAKLTQGDKQTALQMTYHKGNNVLVVRKPGAAMAQPWSISFTY